MGGILLTLTGAFYTIGLFPQLDVASGRFVVDMLGLLVLGLAPLGLGLGSLWYSMRRLRLTKRAQQTQREAELIRRILSLAKERPQGMTASEYSTHTACGMPEVEERLRQLYLEGTLDMEVTEQGMLVYKQRPL
jgi:hypothetical protein